MYLKELSDFLFVKSNSIVCISDATVSCFEAHQISGWSIYPVQIKGKQKQTIDGYHGLAITGCVGGFDMSSSYLAESVPLMPGSPPSTVRKGMNLDLESWDGSDICAIEDNRYIFMNQRAYSAISDCGLTGIPLTPVDQFEILEFILTLKKIK